MTDRVRNYSVDRVFPLVFGVLVLILAIVQLYVSGQFMHNFGNIAAVKQLFGESSTSTSVASASDYFLGLVAYGQENYPVASQKLHAAITTHKPYARHWIALAMEQEGQSAAGRAALDLSNRSEMLLYSDMLLRQWQTASADEKDRYRNFLKVQEPGQILPFAERLLNAGYHDDASTWATAIPNYKTDMDALTLLGKAALGQNDQATAEKWFGSAYALKQNSATAYLYGLALALGSQPERAINVLETGIADAAGNDPTLPWLFRMLAIAYARIGKCSETEKVFDQAAASDPGDENQQRVAASRDQYLNLCQSQK